MFIDSHSTTQIGNRVQYRAQRTLEDWKQQATMACQFFGELRLDEIKPHHFSSYQMLRASGEGFTRRVGGTRKGWKEVPTACGPAKINDELAFVRRVMEEAMAWTPVHKLRYHELQEPDNYIPKALSPAEQQHWLTTARADTDTHVIWWYGLVALDTTFSSDEMRTIRQGEVNFAQQILAVNRKFGKNAYRRREIPIEDPDCMWALEQLVRRSIDLVGRSPAHYLFPKRVVRGQYNPLEPTGRHGCLRPLHDLVRERSGLEWFSMNCWRHTAITRMAEQGVPIASIMARAGHISPKMTGHYTHISEQAQRLAQRRLAMNKHPQRTEAWARGESWAQPRPSFGVA